MRLAKFSDQVADFNDLLWIKPDRRLVQDDHLGVAKQRLGDSDTLTVSLGKRSDHAVLYIVDAGLPHGFPDLFPQHCSSQPFGLAYKRKVFKRSLIQI